MNRKFLVAALALVASGPGGTLDWIAPPKALAWDVEINSETIGQGYQLIGGTGDVITRRRLDQYLGLSVWNIGNKDAYGQPTLQNQFYFTSSLRMEFDFGNFPRSTWGEPARDVSQELGTNRFDLLYFYFGGKDVWGFVDFKLGRQIDFNLFEFMSFDGLSFEVKTPWYFSVGAYGGLLVNGALPIDSPLYRPDGTAPGVLNPYWNEIDPVVGVNVRAFGFRDLDAMFGYRRVFSPGTDVGCTLGSTDLQVIDSCAKTTSGTTEEVIGWQARYRLLNGLLIPWAGFRYNLLVGVFDVAEAGMAINISPMHALRLEYLYSFPTFDGDSIWNVFARSQIDDVRVGYDFRYRNLRAWARALARIYHDINGGTNFSPSGQVDGGGDLGARIDWKPGYLRADLYGEFGYGGTKTGVDVASRMNVWRDILALEGRLTFVHFEDDLRPIDSADSFGIQVGARFSPWKGMLLHLLFEDNINKFYASQIRLYAVLDVSALIGGYGFAPGTLRGIGPGLGNFGNAYGPGQGY